MKELSIEEKAKRYDEAIEVAKSNYATIAEMDENCTFARSGIINTFHHMFPELKESSEDEKIRNEICIYIGAKQDISLDKHNRWLAWLEKQSKESIIEAFRLEYEKGKADALQEQRKEWTAEDLLNRNQIADILQEYNRNDLIKWLEMQSKKGTNGNEREIPNSVWSEEDKNRFRNLIYLVEHSEEGIGTKRGFIEFINRLKSLKDKVQPQWKPSDEQMYILNWVINVFLNQKSIVEQSVSNKLQSLYNELKKLKKE